MSVETQIHMRYCGSSGHCAHVSEEQALKTGDWKWQARMMDAMMSAFEANLVGFK